MITQDDISMIDHFWFSYNDLERWSQWEERLADLPPYLVKAWKDYKEGKEMLDNIIEDLKVDAT